MERSASDGGRQRFQDLYDAAAGLRHRAVTALTEQRPWWRRWQWWHATSHPELRKIVETLPEAVDDVTRLLARSGAEGHPLDDRTRTHLLELFGQSLEGMTIESGWQLLDALHAVGLQLGQHDTDHVAALLDLELAHETRQPALSAAASGDEAPLHYAGWGRARWSDVFPLEALSDLRRQLGNGRPVEARVLDSTYAHLAMLGRVRAENGRKRRTRLALRNRFFVYALLVLAPLVGGLCAAASWASDGSLSGAVVVLVAVAGGLGATVAGAFKLRELLTMTEFRLLGAGLAVQPFIGAAAATFLLLVLQSELVVLPGTDAPVSWAALGTYGFAAGFSEPFFVGIVRRLAAPASSETAAATPTGTGSASGR